MASHGICAHARHVAVLQRLVGVWEEAQVTQVVVQVTEKVGGYLEVRRG